MANFGYCYRDLFVPTGIEACGNSHRACFLNLHYCQDFSVLFMSMDSGARVPGLEPCLQDGLRLGSLGNGF